MEEITVTVEEVKQSTTSNHAPPPKKTSPPVFLQHGLTEGKSDYLLKEFEDY